MDFDQTQVLPLEDDLDETYDEASGQDLRKVVGYLKVFCQKGFPETSFPVFEGDNVIGRQEDKCNIHIPIKALSKQHACIEVRGSSHMIYDKSSRNKTRKGSRLLNPDIRYDIQHKDKLILADVDCVYYMAEELKKSQAENEDSGSETDSESMFTEHFQDVGGGDASKTYPNQMAVVADEEDNSSDIIQPTQTYGMDNVLVAESDQSDEEDKTDAMKTLDGDNSAVVETPFVKKTDNPAEASLKIQQSLLYEEYDEDSETDISKALVQPMAGRELIAESDIDDGSDGNNSYVFEAATQAFPDRNAEIHVHEAATQMFDKEKKDTCQDSAISKGKCVHNEPTMVYEVESTQTFEEGIQAKAESTRISSLASDSSSDRNSSFLKGKDKMLNVSFDDQPTQMYPTEDTESDTSTLPVPVSPVKSPAKVQLARGTPTLKRLYPPSPSTDNLRHGEGHTDTALIPSSAEETANSGNSLSTVAVTSSFDKSSDKLPVDPGKPALKRLIVQSEDDINNEDTQAYVDREGATLAVESSPEIPSKLPQAKNNSGISDENQPCHIEATQPYGTCSPTQSVDGGRVSVESKQEDSTREKDHREDTDATQPYEMNEATQAYDMLQHGSDETKEQPSHTTDSDSKERASLEGDALKSSEVMLHSGQSSLEQTIAYEDIEPTQMYGTNDATQAYEMEGTTQPVTDNEETQDIDCEETQGYGIVEEACEVEGENSDLAKGKNNETEATQLYGPQDSEERVPESDESDDETLLHPIIPLPTGEMLDTETPPSGLPESMTKHKNGADKLMQTPVRINSSKNETDDAEDEVPDFVSPVIPVIKQQGSHTSSTAAPKFPTESKEKAKSQNRNQTKNEATEQSSRRKSGRMRVQKKAYDPDGDSNTMQRIAKGGKGQGVPRGKDDGGGPADVRGQNNGTGQSDLPGEVEKISDQTNGRTSRGTKSAIEQKVEHPCVQMREDDEGPDAQALEVKGQNTVTDKSDQLYRSKETTGQRKTRAGRGRKSAGGQAAEKNSTSTSEELDRGNRSVPADVTGDVAEIAMEKGSEEEKLNWQGSGGKPEPKPTHSGALTKNVQNSNEKSVATAGKKIRSKRSLTFKSESELDEKDEESNSDVNLEPRGKNTRGRRSVTFKAEAESEQNEEENCTSNSKKTRGRKSLQSDTENKVSIKEGNRRSISRSKRNNVPKKEEQNSDTESLTRMRERRGQKVLDIEQKTEKEETPEKPQSNTRRTRSLERRTDEKITTRARGGSKPPGGPLSVRRSTRGCIDEDESEEMINTKKVASKNHEESKSKTSNIRPVDATVTSSRSRRGRRSQSSETIVEKSDGEHCVESASVKARVHTIKGSEEKPTKQKSSVVPADAAATSEPLHTETNRESRSKHKSDKEGQKEEVFVKPNDVPAQTKRTLKTSDKNNTEEVISDPERGSRKKREVSSDSQTGGTSSKRSKRSSPGTPSREDNTLQGMESPSLRQRAFNKPKIIFTGVLDEDGSKTIKNLGGELGQSIHECTHLVTDKVRRTLKFLCALGRGIPIVSIDWIDRCKDAHTFIDAHPFLVKDTAAEQKFKFCLSNSIEKASMGPLLAGYKIYATKSTAPPPTDIKEIVKCAGGQYLATMPKKAGDHVIVIVGENEEAKNYQSAVKLGIPCVSPEFLLTGLLRQEIDIDSYAIRLEDSSAGTGRKRNNTGTASSATKKKRR